MRHEWLPLRQRAQERLAEGTPTLHPTPEQQAGIHPAEAEAIGQRVFHRPAPGFAANQVEALGVGVGRFQVERGGGELVAQCQDREDRLDAAGSARRWPVADLVALMASPLPVPNTALMAASSPLSPTWVEVAWAFRCCTAAASTPAWRSACCMARRSCGRRRRWCRSPPARRWAWRRAPGRAPVPR